MRTCDECGTVSADDSKYCPTCGKELFDDVALEPVEGEESVLDMDLEQAVQLAKQGDNKGFEYLYSLTYKDKKYLALKYVNNESDAEDVLQNSYIKMMNNIATLEDAKKFNGWFGMIVANTAKDHLRKVKKMDSEGNSRRDVMFSELEMENSEGESLDYEFEDEKSDWQPEVAYTQKETQELVQAMMANLSDEQRMALVMFHLEGLSIKEIAETMDVSENTVKSRLNYARKNIKEQGEELRKKGYKLYSYAPLPLLLYLLRMEAGLSGAVGISQSVAGVATAGAIGSDVVAGAAGSSAATGIGEASSAGASKIGALIAKIKASLAAKLGIGAAVVATGTAVILALGGNDIPYTDEVAFDAMDIAYTTKEELTLGVKQLEGWEVVDSVPSWESESEQFFHKDGVYLDYVVHCDEYIDFRPYYLPTTAEYSSQVDVVNKTFEELDLSVNKDEEAVFAFPCRRTQDGTAVLSLWKFMDSQHKLEIFIIGNEQKLAELTADDWKSYVNLTRDCYYDIAYAQRVPKGEPPKVSDEETTATVTGTYLDEYRHILQENKQGILNYDYSMSVLMDAIGSREQMSPEEVNETFGVRIQPIYVEDVLGDENPELLFVTMPDINVHQSELHIYSVFEGEVVEIDLPHSDFDNVSDFGVVNEIQYSGKRLVWSHFVRKEEQLETRTTHIYMDVETGEVLVEELEQVSAGQKQQYMVNGESVDQSEYPVNGNNTMMNLATGGDGTSKFWDPYLGWYRENHTEIMIDGISDPALLPTSYSDDMVVDHKNSGEYRLPYINYRSSACDEINRRIADDYADFLEESGQRDESVSVGYDWWIYDDMLVVRVDTKKKEDSSYVNIQPYIVDLKNDVVMGQVEMMEYTQLSADVYNTVIRKALAQYAGLKYLGHDSIMSLTQEGFDEIQTKLSSVQNDNYNKTVSDENIAGAAYYIGKYGERVVAGNVYDIESGEKYAVEVSVDEVGALYYQLGLVYPSW